MNKWFRLLRYDWPLHFILVLTNWMPDNVAIINFRGFLVSPFFKKCGKRIQIGRDVTFYDPSKIQIGENVYFAKGVWICGGEYIYIGNNVQFGPYSIVVTSNHKLVNGSYFNQYNSGSGNVFIGDGCWLAAHSVILGKSKLNQGTLIGANSVFKGTSEINSVYAGVPCKFIRYAE